MKELVGARPALARAAWDWGYGDWETALGAASHVGNKEIAGLLLAAGAHPTIFSAAMLGQLDAVKAFVASTPGIQKTRGPHGITLLDHARNGKSVEVVKYLESLGDADRNIRTRHWRTVTWTRSSARTRSVLARPNDSSCRETHEARS